MQNSVSSDTICRALIDPAHLAERLKFSVVFASVPYALTAAIPEPAVPMRSHVPAGHNAIFFRDAPMKESYFAMV